MTESDRRSRNLPRRLVAVLATAALLFAAFLVMDTSKFVSKSQAGVGKISAREKVGFRSWQLSIQYGDAAGAMRDLRVTGYYDGKAYAPDAAVNVRFADGAARLAALEDLWLDSFLATIFGGLLVWLYFLLR